MYNVNYFSVNLYLFTNHNYAKGDFMFQHQLDCLQILSTTHKSDNHLIATGIKANPIYFFLLDPGRYIYLDLIKKNIWGLLLCLLLLNGYQTYVWLTRFANNPIGVET